jgi:hypothetical protein
VRRASALHLAPKQPQQGHHGQHGHQQQQGQQGQLQAPSEQQEEAQAAPWWLRHPAAVKAAATHAHAHAPHATCVPAASPALPPSLLATPGGLSWQGGACLAPPCAAGQPTPPVSAGASSGLLTAPSSGRGSLLLPTPDLPAVARRASAASVPPAAAPSGKSADLGGRPPGSPCGGAAAAAEALQRQRHLLEVKTQHAYPCTEVVLQVGEEAPLGSPAPSILSAFFRLASRLAG